MELSNPRQALALGGLLIVTLAAGCAGGQAWSNNRYGYNGGGWGSSYPNVNNSGGPYPSDSVFRSDVTDDSNHAYAYDVSHKNPPSGDGSQIYARVNANAPRQQEPQADRHADRSDDRSASAER